MAVFGFQMLLTIVSLLALNKISLRGYSFTRWLLFKGGLTLYLHPSNERLKEAIAASNGTASATAPGNSGGKHTRSTTITGARSRRQHARDQQATKTPETFTVPRTLTLTLDSEPLADRYVEQLPYFHDLQWLCDFSLATILIYFATEIWYTFAPPEAIGTEYNLSLMWCCLAAAFAIKTLFAITAAYFRGGDESMGERSIVIVFACLFFLVAMVALIPAEHTLEFGLAKAHETFAHNTRRLLEFQGVTEQSSGPISFLIFQFWLAIICGAIGAIFIFPGLRVAKMHKDALEYACDNRAIRILYNVSFISPLFIVLFWIKPIARHYFTVREWPNRGVLLSSDSFETLRLVFIVAVVALRFTLFRRYLQAYLNIAPQRLSYLRKESSKITNLDMQKMIARVSYYLCVAAIQFIAPLILCLCLTLLAKSSGDYRWTPRGGTSLCSSSSPKIETNQSSTNYQIIAQKSVINNLNESETTTTSQQQQQQQSQQLEWIEQNLSTANDKFGTANLTNITSTNNTKSNFDIIDQQESSKEAWKEIDRETVEEESLRQNPAADKKEEEEKETDQEPQWIKMENASKIVSNLAEKERQEDHKDNHKEQQPEQQQSQQSERDIARISLALLKDVFQPIVFRGVIGFLLWWTVTAWFATQAIGFMYHSYFED